MPAIYNSMASISNMHTEKSEFNLLRKYVRNMQIPKEIYLNPFITHGRICMRLYACGNRVFMMQNGFEDEAK